MSDPTRPEDESPGLEPGSGDLPESAPPEPSPDALPPGTPWDVQDEAPIQTLVDAPLIESAGQADPAASNDPEGSDESGALRDRYSCADPSIAAARWYAVLFLLVAGVLTIAAVVIVGAILYSEIGSLWE